ncbi:MAG: hypothetical protein CMJ29_01640 [Phycisphaerae bacterium]|nr:hypothetical protein [Phycisphaerae bacterium]MAT80332.1 hypothetical protein [Phycisphaerae bacterium]
MKHPYRSLLAPCLLFPVLMLVTGCQAPSKMAEASNVDVRTQLVMTQGDSDDVINWNDFIERASMADIIVLGEEHDDATGHAVQLAVVEDVMTRRGGGTLALEMLERDEQLLIDDLVEGIIDHETFMKETASASWAGKGSWSVWYQPVIEAAISNDGRIIAANAPRRYVRLARTRNWDALEQLPPERSRFVSIPNEPIEGVYRERFFEIMQPADQGHSEDEDGKELDLSHIEPFYRAQQIWDATMADSVADAIETHGSPVILLVGRFHSDHDGGTVQEIRRLLPDHEILVVSLETNRGPRLEAGSDVPQADVIIHTNTE